MRKLIVVAAVLVPLTLMGAYLAQAQKADDTPAPIPAQSAPASVEAAPKNIVTKPDTTRKVESYLIKDAPLKTDFVMGKKNAPIVMVEYASMSCPHCAHFANQELPKLEEKYIKTGKLLYVLRQFPINAPAMSGAMLVNCVGKQSPDQYYTFARVLFEAQDKWAFDTNYMTGLQTIAAVGGVDGEQFQACMNKDNEMEVLKDKKLAMEMLNIPHTPYFYIDGYAYEGPKTFEGMAKVIDEKLAKAK